MGDLDKARLRSQLANDVRLRLMGGIMKASDTLQFEKDLRALMKRFDAKVK